MGVFFSEFPMSRIEKLAATVSAVARPGLKPKEIIAEVRRRHRKARRKDVVRAAFYALIEASGQSGDKNQVLHNLAITQRAPGENEQEALNSASSDQGQRPGSEEQA
jgi:hypothetical protein